VGKLRTLDRLIQRLRFRAAVRYVPPGSKVLDIGSADGAWFTYLGARIGSSVGLDPNVLEQTTAEGHRLIHGTLDTVDLDEDFDCVTALAVLEHLSDDELAEIGRQVRTRTTDGAVLVATVPSAAVDRILDVGIRLRLLDGMEADEHHGLDAGAIPKVLAKAGWSLRTRKTFELGLNNLFVLERSSVRQ
jgi:SAM-dependent methyltransferase